MAPVFEKLEAKFKGLLKRDKSPGRPEGSDSKKADNKDAAPAAPEIKVEEPPTKSEDHNIQLADKPVFDNEHVAVVFVLGGPGAGKGTQCSKLVSDYKFVHLSAGDLLRGEQHREGSPYGAMISNYIKEGQIVPQEVTIKLLQNAMQEAIDARTKEEGEGTIKTRFLIDGFPRKMDQAIQFEKSVCIAAKVLFLSCPEKVLLERLLERGKTSGREDDNEESIKKRFKTFIETSMPVVDYYRKEDKVADVESVGSIDEVYDHVKAGLKGVID